MASIGPTPRYIKQVAQALASAAGDRLRTQRVADKALAVLEGRAYSTGALNESVAEGETLTLLLANTGSEQLAMDTIVARVGAEYRVTKTFNPTVDTAGTALDIRNKRSGASDSVTATAERDGGYSGGDAFSPSIIGERKAAADIGSSPGSDPVNSIDPGDSMLIELENTDSQGPAHASIDVDFIEQPFA
jgi:hypothetical protein